jgi:hypothetical protein
MRYFRSACLAAFILATGSAAHAAPTNPYGDYAALIGEWDVSAESGGPPVAVSRFKWGPNHAYIWASQTILMNGKEYPHFEGVMLWNGVDRRLDLLVEADLNSGLAEEKGVFRTDGQGGWVREIDTAFSEGARPLGLPAPGPEGVTVHFRQTLTPQSPDRILTSVMRQTGTGWTPTFPGGDHLIMTRRKES